MSSDFRQEEIVLHLSDLHYGEIVKSEHNTYNTSIACKRLDYYFDKCIRIGRDMYSKIIPITKAHVFLTGDMVLNETMRGSQMMAAECNIVEQVNGVADILAENIANFLVRWKAIKELHVYGVTGNHGRLGKPGENDAAANFDRQVYDRIAAELRYKLATLKPLADRRIICHFPRRGESVVGRVAGHTIVAHHGDGIKSQLGIPYYGMSRLRDRLYKMFRGKMDVLLVGHFHRRFVEHDGTIQTIMVPSLVGWNEYSGKLGMGHDAGQNLYMVCPTHGITAIRTINVGHIQD